MHLVKSFLVGALIGQLASAPAFAALPSPAFANGTFTGNFLGFGAFALDTRFAGGTLGTPANGSFLAAGGNAISYVPLIQGVGVAVGNAPTNDHQRATGLFTSATSDDGHSQENTLGVETLIATGYNSAWTASTSYPNLANVYNAAAGSGAYRQVSGSTCTSGSTIPSGFGNGSQQQNDGSCVWQWINLPNVSAKVGIYSEEKVAPGAGNTWNMALNTLLMPGTPLSFHANAELDFGNNSGECYGSSNCINLDIETGGAYRSTHAVLIATQNSGSVYATHFGLRLAGSMLASDADFDTDASGAVGIGNCATGFVSCTHSSAGYLDQASSPVAMQFHQPASVTGTMHSVGTIVDDTTSPTFASIAGVKSFAGIYEHSTTPIGIRLSGTYSQFQITGTGWNVDTIGQATVRGLTAANYVSAPSFTETLTTPASSTAFCNPGQFTDDANYHYVCVAASTWKRVQLLAF